jgi:kynurenine 3-monooxygenase
MLIALPNPDATFTCTLFFPFDGAMSFNSLQSKMDVEEFLKSTFPDAYSLMPDAVATFVSSPASSLVTVKCFPWTKNKTLLIGDAAHAIVPFFGQGMNAGFEDCRILNELLHDAEDWTAAFQTFQKIRKPDTDAIAQLALDNFVEMRDLVADARFLLRKKIEANLSQRFPEKWMPLYTMVTFRDDIGYADALRIGQRQKQIMDMVMLTPDIESAWQHLNFEEIVDKL